MDKDYIISEIRRTASENGGVALGKEKFCKTTGIKEGAWYGRYWRGWGEALQESGFLENQFGAPAYGHAVLVEALAKLTRTIGRFPAKADLMFAKRRDAAFPSRVTFDKNLGSKSAKVALVRQYVEEHKEYADILDLLPLPEKAEETPDNAVPSINTKTKEGFVYLGMLRIDTKKRYKIGKTNLVERRNAELSLQLPEKLDLVHYIKTDDMSGIETYWHKRFADKNTNGEWFDLSSDEVRAFKLRKFM